jgi:S-formylglutathione hydrolase FrmB
MWAENMGLAVVMPSGENAFYMDVLVKNGCLGDFGEYVGHELVEVTREMFPLSREREDTFIGGLSMGGFGACRTGLKYCNVFSKTAVLSGALHIYEYPREWVETKGNTIGEVRNFGVLDETENSDRNPRYLIRKISEDPALSFPDFYIACGLQDVLLEANRSIAAALKEAGADVVYEEGEGIHDWIFWDTYIRHVLRWLDIDMKDRQIIAEE